MAASKAMVLPEIVAAVITQMDHDLPTIRACARVNELWAEEATSQLWRSNPPIHALAALPGDRLQYYADKIVDLQFSAYECKFHHHFTFTVFPRLETIVMHGSEYNQDLYLEQYLQPRLRRFDVFGGLLTDGFLAKMQVCLTYSRVTRNAVSATNIRLATLPAARKGPLLQPHQPYWCCLESK